MSTKYEGAIKEKMLMKLEKDRLIAKVENLEANLAQIKEDGGPGPQGAGLGDESQIDLKSSPTKTHVSSKIGGSPGKFSSAAALPQGKTPGAYTASQQQF